MRLFFKLPVGFTARKLQLRPQRHWTCSDPVSTSVLSDPMSSGQLSVQVACIKEEVQSLRPHLEQQHHQTPLTNHVILRVVELKQTL